MSSLRLSRAPLVAGTGRHSAIPADAGQTDTGTRIGRRGQLDVF